MSAVNELLRLYRRDGKLAPEQVVGEAVDPSSPLHTHFEWNDTVAAHRWRLEQASQLIRRVEIRIRLSEGNEMRVRAITHISGGGYKPTAEVLGNKKLRDRLMADLQRDIDLMVRRYERFSEAAGMLAYLKAWMREHGSSWPGTA